jgi:hypothetical protein
MLFEVGVEYGRGAVNPTPQSGDLIPPSSMSRFVVGPDACSGEILGMASHGNAPGFLCYICWASDVQQITENGLLTDMG